MIYMLAKDQSSLLYTPLSSASDMKLAVCGNYLCAFNMLVMTLHSIVVIKLPVDTLLHHDEWFQTIRVVQMLAKNSIHNTQNIHNTHYCFDEGKYDYFF